MNLNSGTRRVSLVTNPVITHECDYEIGAYPWSFVTEIFRNANQVKVATVLLSK